jgi:large subunit ribosomal protein L17
MNHNSKKKNFNMNTAHRKAVFTNMIKSFEQNGHLTTTLPKAKELKNLLSNANRQVKMVRLGARKGDSAEMAKVMSKEYIDRMNNKKSQKKKNKE